jgi:hypothetical protein
MNTTPATQAFGTKAPRTYTLICYRPNGIDTCRNCVMDRSDSDFELRTFDEPEAAAEFWAQKLWEDGQAGRAYCSWEITLLIDGREDWYDDRPDSAELEAEFDHVQALVKVAQARKADQDRQTRERLEAEAAAAKKAADEAAERTRVEQMRQAYVQLKAIFEGDEGPGAKPQ